MATQVWQQTSGNPDVETQRLATQPPVTRQIRSNMAAAVNDVETPLREMEQEQEEAEAMDRESDDEEGVGVDNSDEDGDTSEDERENEAEIQRLEEQLSINVFDYNCHVDLIKLLRQEGKLQRLRTARQKMSELFPLTEEIWLDWLKDEMNLAEDEPDRVRVYELFEKAVSDYICPEIWLEYAQYSIGGMGSPGGVGTVRDIFERALTAAGLHMTKGAVLWEAYREFEMAILSTVQPPPGSVPAREQQEQLSVQLERVHVLFRRQLAVPLLDMDGTYAEYSEWAGEAVPDAARQQYKKALQQMEKNKPYEEALLVSEAPKMAEYQAYIDFELKEGDPARIQNIFERALAENCLVPDLWGKYTSYLDRQLKIKGLVLSAHERAVRNCPWTMGLWKSYLLALERHGAEHPSVSDVFQKALNAGFIQAADYVEIWQAYLDYLRRRVDFSREGSRELEELRAAFTQALDYLKQDVEERFTETGDLTCNIMQIWARIEALHCKNMQKARELWDVIMTKGNSRYANMWLEYYNLERSYGDTQHCRKALHRAVQCTSDYPEHVCEVLITFERVEGTLEDWDTAVQKTEGRLARIGEQRARAAAKEAELQRQEDEKAEQRRRSKAEKKPQKKVQKRRAEGQDQFKKPWGDGSGRPQKRRRGEGDSQDTLELMETESEAPGRKAEPGPGAKRPQQEAPDEGQEEDRDDRSSVFVSNLTFALEEPEKQMRDAFGRCGAVRQVRPVFSSAGAFRGYCYVQFQDQLAVAEALKLDRQELAGRPMFVSPCVDKKKNPDFKVFKYSSSLEKDKVFISGLPYSCTKEQLEELCRPHGAVRAIRMVTNRSGKPKGLAYVEFEDEAQALQAVLKMDGMLLQDHKMSVAISNPPRRSLADATSIKPLGAMVPRQLCGA
ncbi:spliceosome associated factor 3, U4/U6 recycling protein isoform X2 [Denticeps clupeoides]|nr:squamous cell carcinoma antigen recognized by T-cells 3 isoform X2 [Denticeps clupeoides]